MQNQIYDLVISITYVRTTFRSELHIHAKHKCPTRFIMEPLNCPLIQIRAKSFLTTRLSLGDWECLEFLTLQNHVLVVKRPRAETKTPEDSSIETFERIFGDSLSKRLCWTDGLAT